MVENNSAEPNPPSPYVPPPAGEIQALLKAARPELEAITQRANMRLQHPVHRGTLYHYTTLDGMRGIIDSGEVWATDIRYLNDALELEYGNNLVTRALKTRAETLTDAGERELFGRLIHTFDFRSLGIGVFSTSFSEDGDHLGQWRGYAGGVGGVALGFEFDHWPPHDYELVKIEYNEAAQEALVASLLDDLIASYRRTASATAEPMLTFLKAEYCRGLRMAAATLLLRFKSRHWHSEAEWRLVVGLDLHHESERVQFRSGHVGLVPYTKLAPKRFAGPGAQKLPLKEIVLGPSHFPDLSLGSLRAYLAAKGYQHIEVRVSDVPLRF